MSDTVVGQTDQFPTSVPADPAEVYHMNRFQHAAQDHHPHQEQAQPQGPASISQSDNIYRRLDNSMQYLQARPRTPLLPALSPATEEILARVQSQTAPIEKQQGVEKPSVHTIQDSSLLIPGIGAVSIMDHSRTPSSTFDKSKLKSAFASILTPKSKVLPSQTPKTSDDTPEISTASNQTLVGVNQDNSSQTSNPLQSGSTVTLTKTTSDIQDSTSHELAVSSSAKTTPMLTQPPENTIHVATTSMEAAQIASSLIASKVPPNSTPAATTTSALRRKHTYVLPDGTIRTSGKGLGRGRPGIKRGPKKSRSSPAEVSTVPPSPQNPKKRKRSEISDDEENIKAIISDDDESEAGSEEYAPQATQTRSGRHTQRPTTFVPATESPAARKPRLSDGQKKSPIRPKTYRGKEQNALCEHCSRGHGPSGNAIVFCDGCNKCWHQRCHDPMIPKELVVNTAKEWFCASCTATLSEVSKEAEPAVQQKGKEPATVTPGSWQNPVASSAPSIVNSAPPNEHMMAPQFRSLVEGRSMTKDQRHAYLATLPRERLIELLCYASDVAPHLPLFPPPSSTPAPSAPPTEKPAPSTSKAPTKQLTSYPTPTQDLSDSDDDDDDEYYYDEHAKLYPKPGNGVKLPPESEDLDMLLEGSDCETFSHVLRGKYLDGPAHQIWFGS